MSNSRFVKGQVAWNKGTRGVMKPNITSFKKGRIAENKKEHIKKTCKCGKVFFVKQCLDRVKCCSRSCARKGLPSPMNGKLFSDASRLKMRLAKLGHSGPSHWNYRGYNGRTERKIEMSRDRYRLWRKFIFEIDNYTCQKCHRRGCYLEADHKLSWRNFPDERYKFSNGQTLCRPCHKATINFGSKTRSNNAV